MNSTGSSPTATAWSVVVGVPAEQPGEHRVSLMPESVRKLVTAGAEVLVESGAGALAYATDAEYTAAGARVVSRREVLADSILVTCVHPLQAAELHDGQILVGLLGRRSDTEAMSSYAERGVTVVSLDELPRKLSRAQAMDALTSQANLAGYKAVLVAATAYPSAFPLLMTAAGTLRPAMVLVLGAGVAGLQAIATAARLGAVVHGYDVRPEARGEIESLGARFLDLGITSSGSGGYARELATDETSRQQTGLAQAIGKYDVVITTAQVPGRTPPLLVTEEALAQLRPGSVVVDLASSGFGGNVAGSVPGQTIATAYGVTVVGAGELAGTIPAAASLVYSRNLVSVVEHLLADGRPAIDLDDPIQAAVVLTYDHRTVTPEDHDELQPVR
ncbi:NAD(P) transhydrogenase subunit alpha [Kribbella voronezhensis]|uniref:proton-translocating NAD(P)(+) transhydrogenase n=1 Tax=Kribbella voronezhensis TaxID=2512212 RepID=A0A4R7SZ50_9ACTN|nr:NAD(P) transhydrogenase subunit alpha [Kribbella voronezhensis]TDU83818.1 NAD(P) transhydrogenase subunit alpha [Kribbella voronezhensis]